MTNACEACGAPLAAGQRYCLNCGERRGPLPESVAGMLAGMSREPPRLQAPELPPPPLADERVHSGPFPRLPGPQALAAILLAALGFGVLAGSLAPGPLGSLASAPLSIFVHLPPHRATPVAAVTPDTSAASDSTASAQTQQTITVTTPAPSTSTPPSSTTPASTAPTTTTPKNNSGTGGLLGLPPIKHVFLIVLSNQGFSQTFAPGSGDTYLSHTLPKQGELIEDYYGTAGSSLANGVALISGQGPTALSEFNCPQYTPIDGAKTGKEGQVVGDGCVYPKTTLTIADEMAKKGLTWRAYVDGIGAPCRHPLLGASDPNFAPSDSSAYVTWRDPFVYFRSVTTKPTCLKDDVDLTQLTQDLQFEPTTPALSYIVPSPCEDGDATPCQTGAPGGLAPADAFVRKLVGQITRSPAYKAGGLIAITFDHAPQSGPGADANACCTTPPYPNVGTPAGVPSTEPPPPPNPGDVPGQTTPTGGGGQVGLVLLSAYVKPGTVEAIDYYNHFSLLATIESMFGLKRLGFAGDASLPLFDSVIFNRHPKSG